MKYQIGWSEQNWLLEKKHETKQLFRSLVLEIVKRTKRGLVSQITFNGFSGCCEAGIITQHNGILAMALVTKLPFHIY